MSEIFCKQKNHELLAYAIKSKYRYSYSAYEKI